MSRLLALTLSTALVAVLGLGTTGCGKKKDKDKTTTAATATATDAVTRPPTTEAPPTTTRATTDTPPPRTTISDKTTTAGKEKPDLGSVALSADPVEIELKDKKGKGTAKITATRKNYDDPITLKFSGAPKGVEFKDATIAKGEKSATVDVIVTDGAPGDHDITVSGTAGTATVESAKFKLKLK